MELIQPSEPPTATPAPPEPDRYAKCDECGAPVDQTQRYCVNCGAHRRGVNDPAARYLSEASARARRPVRSTAARRSRPRSDLLAALAVALVPVAAAVGVAVGRSSNSQDSKLIQALERQRAQVVTTAAATGSTGSATTATGTTHHKASAGSSKTGGGKAISTTKFGSVSKISGQKVTQSQEQQGAAAAQSVQKSTGQSYVQSANKLPSTIAIP
jgi:hypothetical protein